MTLKRFYVLEKFVIDEDSTIKEGVPYCIFVDAEDAATEIARLHARIDALMFEYCPKEMTMAQLETWARSQRASTGALPDHFRHWVKDCAVPYAGCICATCEEWRAEHAVETSEKGESDGR